MATLSIVPGILLSTGNHVFPSSGFYTGVDDATDIYMTGATLSSTLIEVDRYEFEEFQETLDMTFNGSGVIATQLLGRDGEGNPAAIFPEGTGLKVRMTISEPGITTVALTTAP